MCHVLFCLYARSVVDSECPTVLILCHASRYHDKFYQTFLAAATKLWCKPKAKNEETNSQTGEWASKKIKKKLFSSLLSW